MKQMKQWLRWGMLLWKRLYKKAAFLLLLVLIPVLVFGYGQTAQEESGLMTVALASRPAQVETLTRQVWDDLQESQVVRYIECATAEEARQLVLEGQADVAWIFEENIEEKIYDFVAKRSRTRAFLTILEPENRVALKLARELLSGVMFPHCSETVYLYYIRENAPELAGLSDETLLDYYQGVEFSDDLFVFSDIEGNLQAPEEEPNYLLAPVRGMLAVVAVLAGLATAMFYIRDEENGTFALIPLSRRGFVEFGCQLISLFNVVAVALLSLALARQTADPFREVAVAFLYSLCVAGFSMLVRRLTGGIRGLGMVTPLLVVVMLVVCPVFFDLGALRSLQYLLPPTYFVNGAYSSQFLTLMGAYAAACLLLCAIIDCCKLKFARHSA